MDVSLLTLLILNNSSDGVLFVNSTYFLDFELVLLHQPWVLWFPMIFLLVLMDLSDFFEFGFFKPVFSLRLRYLKNTIWQIDIWNEISIWEGLSEGAHLKG